MVIISERYKNLPDAQDLYEQSLSKAVTFTSVSDSIYKSSGGDTKSFQERIKTWAQLYGKEGVENVNVYGEFIRTDIKSDVSTCMEQVLPIIK